MGFYGCLRASEFTVNTEFDPDVHVCVNDVSFHVEDNVPYLKLHLQCTKMGGSVSVVIGCSHTHVCAYCELKNMLKARQSQHLQHPALFVFSKGMVLKKSLLISHIKFCLSSLGLQSDLYFGHSLRAGSATTAGTKQFQGWEVKMLGHWASQYYNIYIRSTSHIARFSQRLATK